MARRHAYRLLLCLVALLLTASAQAQEPLPQEKQAKETKAPEAKATHSAKRAAYMSALLPGSGQVYNGKWWKVPIIYAGFGGLGYMAVSNYKDYKLFLSAYKYKTGNLEEGETLSDDAWRLAEYYQASQLQSYKEAFRRDFELYCILIAAWYGLNIVDAIVDGHLYTYDIGDDLSLHIDPVFTLPETPCYAFGGRQTGLTFTLNF